MSSHAIVKVILRSKATIESPILSRDEAEKALGEINGARVQGTEIVLPWLSAYGGDVEAAHLEDRADPSSPPFR